MHTAVVVGAPSNFYIYICRACEYHLPLPGTQSSYCWRKKAQKQVGGGLTDKFYFRLGHFPVSTAYQTNQSDLQQNGCPNSPRSRREHPLSTLSSLPAPTQNSAWPTLEGPRLGGEDVCVCTSAPLQFYAVHTRMMQQDNAVLAALPYDNTAAARQHGSSTSTQYSISSVWYCGRKRHGEDKKCFTSYYLITTKQAVGQNKNIIPDGIRTSSWDLY